MLEGAVLVGALLLILIAVFIARAEAGCNRQEDYEEYIERICQNRNICPEFVEAMIEKESSWNPKAENGTCIGLMQVDRSIHYSRMEKLGVSDLSDPYDNILVGVDFLEELFYKYEDPAAVLMYYNAGLSKSSGLDAWRAGKISSYAEEILRRSEELERLHGKLPELPLRKEGM